MKKDQQTLEPKLYNKKNEDIQKLIKNEHRKRLYDKILQNGEKSLSEREVLEIILYAANSRKDTKPIVVNLLHKFKSFTRIINADPYELKKIPEIGTASIAVLKTLLQATKIIAKEKILNKNPIEKYDDVIKFCRTIIGHNMKECTLLIFLDNKNQISDYQIQHEGTFDKTPVYTREVSQQAMTRNASGVILVHNHPNDSCNPSSADINITLQLNNILKELSIRLHDHIIICPSGHFSFKKSGLI